MFHKFYFSDEATRVMLELLGTYDEESASLAKDDAEKCVIDFISKPDIFIMDHLLQLKPVMVLQGQRIYQVGCTTQLENLSNIVFY